MQPDKIPDQQDEQNGEKDEDCSQRRVNCQVDEQHHSAEEDEINEDEQHPNTPLTARVLWAGNELGWEVVGEADRMVAGFAFVLIEAGMSVWLGLPARLWVDFFAEAVFVDGGGIGAAAGKDELWAGEEEVEAPPTSE